MNASFASGETCAFLVRNGGGEVWNGSQFVPWSPALFPACLVTATEQAGTGYYFAADVPGAASYELRLVGSTLDDSPVVDFTPDATGAATSATTSASVAAIKAKTDQLPLHPASEETVSAVGSAVLSLHNVSAGEVQSAAQVALTAYSPLTAAQATTNTNNIKAAIPTSSQNADAVWGASGRTLSGFGSLVNDIVSAVWNAPTRLLSAFGFTVNTNPNATEAAIKAKTDLIGTASVASRSDVQQTVTTDPQLSADVASLKARFDAAPAGQLSLAPSPVDDFGDELPLLTFDAGVRGKARSGIKITIKMREPRPVYLRNRNEVERTFALVTGHDGRAIGPAISSPELDDHDYDDVYLASCPDVPWKEAPFRLPANGGRLHDLIKIGI